jgi:hypothetical protein
LGFLSSAIGSVAFLCLAICAAGVPVADYITLARLGFRQPCPLQPITAAMACLVQPPKRNFERSPNHSRKGARILAICRDISLSRGTQSSFPHIIIRTMCAGNCPPGGTNLRTAETVGSVKRSPSGSSSWGGSGCIGFPPNRPICP